MRTFRISGAICMILNIVVLPLLFVGLIAG